MRLTSGMLAMLVVAVCLAPGCERLAESVAAKVHCCSEIRETGLGIVTECDRDCDGTPDARYRFYGGAPNSPDMVYWDGFIVEKDLDGDGTVDLIFEQLTHRGFRRYVAWVDEDADGTVESIVVGEPARDYVNEKHLEHPPY